MVYFLTGASGTGKTTLVSNLKKKYGKRKDWEFLHFDSIGVPSLEDMKKDYGSPENWQKEMTYQWVDRLVNDYRDVETIIFEGQVNPKFAQDAFKKHKFDDYRIVLVDCNPDVMAKRLTHDRNQPELVNEDMRNWLAYLRKQAKSLSIDIIDTSNLTQSQVVKEFENLRKRLA